MQTVQSFSNFIRQQATVPRRLLNLLTFVAILAALFTAVKFSFTLASVGGILLAGAVWLSQRGGAPQVGAR